FSFLSGIGVGLYRSSNNRVMYNKIDWCVRGYSHGVYNRGQDSAGILIYEQSNDNVFAYNSVTHGGDGFFLWAGQTTMDTGKGGCNGNLVFGNDFSHAPTNGIEATFSKNTFANNLVLECWHGVWGGYSWESKVIGNTFGLNAEGIAWEHGQDNQILYNTFDKDRVAIDVWQKDSEDPNWVYAKVRDTRSRDNTVAFNTFRDIAGPVVRISRSFNFHFTDNQVFRTSQLFQLEKETDGLEVVRNQFTVPYKTSFPPDGSDNTWNADPDNTPAQTAMQGSGNLKPAEEPEGAAYLKQFQVGWSPFVSEERSARNDAVRPLAPPTLKDGKSPFLKPGTLRGRKYILVDEWGPYDFQYPVLWPRSFVSVPAQTVRDSQGLEHTTGPLLEQKLEILGPPGTWKVAKTRGAYAISAYSGKVPGQLVLHMQPGKANDVQVDLVYTGAATTDYRGVRTAAGRPVAFSFSHFFAPIDWDVKWFSYDGATQDPRTTDDWKTIIQGTPIYEIKTGELNYAWPGSPGGKVPPDHFLTLATGTFEIAQGNYVLDLTSDDGVRVILDGKTIYEDWTWHGPKNVKIPLKLGGKHSIRVEHFELDGYSTLKAVIDRK
ncbi:MAG TPA: NosD domain-containing protein, partial [Fimbriimonadaceae bacterium]|nr:NosD domain-containing protein [Fimbriimonadaceae bacterium]